MFMGELKEKEVDDELAFHISLGVKGINLEGTRLRMYVARSKVYPREDMVSDEKLIIDLTMSINV